MILESVSWLREGRTRGEPPARVRLTPDLSNSSRQICWPRSSICPRVAQERHEAHLEPQVVSHHYGARAPVTRLLAMLEQGVHQGDCACNLIGSTPREQLPADNTVCAWLLQVVEPGSIRIGGKTQTRALHTPDKAGSRTPDEFGALYLGESPHFMHTPRTQAAQHGGGAAMGMEQRVRRVRIVALR